MLGFLFCFFPLIIFAGFMSMFFRPFWGWRARPWGYRRWGYGPRHHGWHRRRW